MTKKLPKLWSWKRFSNLTKKLESQGKSEKSAKAIAASIWIAKYGKGKMASMASKGRARTY